MRSPTNNLIPLNNNQYNSNYFINHDKKELISMDNIENYIDLTNLN